MAVNWKKKKCYRLSSTTGMKKKKGWTAAECVWCFLTKYNPASYFSIIISNWQGRLYLTVFQLSLNSRFPHLPSPTRPCHNCYFRWFLLHYQSNCRHTESSWSSCSQSKGLEWGYNCGPRSLSTEIRSKMQRSKKV